MLKKKRPTSCFCLKLRRAAAGITCYYDHALEPSGITVSQFSLLLNISKAERGSLAELADMAELDRSTLARNIKPLIIKKLVLDTKADKARDSRFILTEAGRKTLAQAQQLWEAAQSSIAERLGSDGVTELEKVLEALETL